MAFADFQALYKQKLTTADEAVKVIKSGDWVDYGFCAIHPRVLDEALARRAPELEDVKVRGGISLWKPAIFDIEDPVHHIIFNSHHMSSVERHHIASGAGFHEPMRYSELPRYYYDHITPPDVAMFQVTPMDSHGYFSLALNGSYAEAMIDKAKRVFVEVNENQPRCLCGTQLHVSQVDAIVEYNHELPVLPPVAIDEVKRFIAQQDLNAETRFVPEKVIPKVDGEFSEKIAVIGGGPAGLSCAYYLAEKGYRPTVFEREARPGGMLMNGIPSFRLEKDVVEAEIDILRELGVEFRCGVEVGKDVTIAQLREQGYQGFYVAVGLQSGGKLNIPGGDADGVMAGIDFMRQVNLHEKKTLSGKVVVIGGGRRDVSAIYNRQE